MLFRVPVVLLFVETVVLRVVTGRLDDEDERVAVRLVAVALRLYRTLSFVL